ncbi:MAG: sigma-70 family RNA polymerase sigma factor [Oscillospiraceae bacterium]|nr:sigma-70 family RNA polymerase sigma factor [Oscillospiraceae bacterium]
MLTDTQFTQAVEQYADMVYRIALNYLKDPAAAEDTGQEVFFRLLRSRGDFQSEAHLKHWLVRVTINECKRTLASPWRKIESLEEHLGSPVFSTPENREVFDLVMGLPRKYRVTLYLHYYEGYKAAEIAQLLRIPASTVRTRLDRGRVLLKERLTEAEDV